MSHLPFYDSLSGTKYNKTLKEQRDVQFLSVISKKNDRGN